jgi:hypothetical protein
MEPRVFIRSLFRAATIVGVFACSCHAQLGFIVHRLDWREVDVGTNLPVASPNGVIEPGERARILLTAQFTPPVGTQVSFPTIPTGSGTVMGFYRTSFSVWPTEGNVGSWTAAGSSGPFTSLVLDLFGEGVGHLFQNSQGGSWLPDPTNPAQWEANWTPHSYHARTVTMNLSQPFGGGRELWVQYGVDPTTGDPLLAPLPCTGDWNSSIQIPIVPGPSTALPLLLSLAALPRRRRP